MAPQHVGQTANRQDEEDARQIAQLLNGENPGSLEDILNRPLDPGEKADDAINFEDISDDDLAEEEEGWGGLWYDGMSDQGSDGGRGREGVADGGGDGGGDVLGAIIQEGNLPVEGGAVAADGYDFDDLFGDFGDDLNGNDLGGANGAPLTFDFVGNCGIDDQPPESSATLSDLARDGEAIGAETNLFRDVNFGSKGKGKGAISIYIPPPAGNPEELLASLWPEFDRHAPPKFTSMLPPKSAQFVGKTPLKPPKPLRPTKISLEIDMDQEKLFRMSCSTTTNFQRTPREDAELRGIVLIEDPNDKEEESGDDEGGVALEAGHGPISGISQIDIELACQDWDAMLDAESLDTEPGAVLAPANKRPREDATLSEGDDEWLQAFGASQTPAKRQKVNVDGPSYLQLGQKRSGEDDLFGESDDDWEQEFGASLAPTMQLQKEMPAASSKLMRNELNLFEVPWSLDDPERATARIAKHVTLDLNDPNLLVDIHKPTAASKHRRRYGGVTKRYLSGSLTKDLSKRYNISNDHAYEQLKENQSKVRSVIGNLTVEHSMPALRLQYPYYKTRLGVREARSFHRPILSFRPNEMVRFSKPASFKKKYIKGRDTKSIFKTTKDLSLADNSHVLLLEYSEEYPTMMSNFGMHNRVINYYRRKSEEDTSRPKLELGETAVLLPQDKSPFSIFGTVDPGQVTPTLYNAMFRAPIFKQQAKPSDFLVIRNTTGVDGSFWYIRNIQNLYVVGQELPSVEVPGPHARKVTTTAKNRLKMISYRKIKKNEHHRVSVSEVTAHFPETTDMQNRQKLKEFMVFSKEHREWEMKDGDAIPDEDAIRAMIPPEDVCLLESTQVGLRHLQDAGYDKDNIEDEIEEGKEDQSIHQQLAPWHTTKNFLNATQGKAMLELHGEGDPSGRGWAFSYIKTSMKGGFKPVGESVEDRLDSKRKQENGGHSYNVAKQQKAYDQSIAKIWEAQKRSLSSTVEPSDAEVDAGDLYEVREVIRSEAATPAALGHHGDDETTSQYSRISAASQRGRVLRITRDVRNEQGVIERQSEVVRDPRVIRQYLKRRRDLENERIQVADLPNKPTGDEEQDRQHVKRIEEELARLSRNKGRRVAREKQKGLLADGAAMSPDSADTPSTTNAKTGGTSRKCANCGMTGHIKTNKRLCPMLNGTHKPEDGLAVDTSSGLGSMSTLPAL
ncbi:MAG: hypothetical protein M1840_002695 [Geoglossum simile]|nr:MAG: hypothetical protein M1840_002695 [Geoglossum simile]